MVQLGTCQYVGQPVIKYTCSHSVRFYLLFKQIRSWPTDHIQDQERWGRHLPGRNTTISCKNAILLEHTHIYNTREIHFFMYAIRVCKNCASIKHGIFIGSRVLF